MAPQPERYEPLPSPLGLPAFAWRRLPSAGRWALVVVVLAGIVAAALIIPGARSERDLRSAAEAREATFVRAERRARLEAQARPRTARGPAGERRRLVAGLEASILADARRRSALGELRGRYRSATCFGFPKRLGDPPPAEGTGRFVRLECVAVSSRIPTGERTTGSLVGQPFRARIDVARGRYAWCRVVQGPGELAVRRGPPLRPVRACGG